MNKFAYFYHPLNEHDVKRLWPLTNILPQAFIKPFLNLQKLKVIRVKPLTSSTGLHTEGFIIVCPVLPQTLATVNPEWALAKIVAASHLAANLGADILGLHGYFSTIANKKPMLYKHTKIPVTSASTFCAWSAFEAIFRAAKSNKINLKESTLTVFGPVTAVGSLCAKKFSGYVSKIILSGGIPQRLRKLKEQIQEINRIETVIEEDTAKAISNADIIINTCIGPNGLFDVNNIKPQAIVCDTSAFQAINLKANKRQDLNVIDYSLIKLPAGQKLGTALGLPEDLIFADLAETILLALDKRCKDSNVGEDINLDNMEHLADVAVRHGFEVYLP